MESHSDSNSPHHHSYVRDRGKNPFSRITDTITSIFSNRTTAIAGVLILVLGVGAGIIAVQRSTEFRQQATSISIEQGDVSNSDLIDAPRDKMEWNHTIGRADPNGLLVVMTYQRKAAGSKGIGPPAVSYAGKPLTPYAENAYPPTTADPNIKIFISYLKNPPAGNAKIVVSNTTWVNYFLGSAVNYYGVDQTKPFDLAVPYYGGGVVSGTASPLIAHSGTNWPINTWTQKSGQVFFDTLFTTAEPDRPCLITAQTGTNTVLKNAIPHMAFGIGSLTYDPAITNYTISWRIAFACAPTSGQGNYAYVLTKLNPAQSGVASTSTPTVTPTPTKKPNGQPCTANNQCISNLCMGGVCTAVTSSNTPTITPTLPPAGGTGAPPAPTNLQATCNSTNTQGIFSWTGSAGAVYSFNYTGPSGNTGWSPATNPTTVNVTAGANYIWKVRACNSSGSACSDYVNGPTLVCGVAVSKPAAPVLNNPILNCSAGNSQAVINWNSVSGATGYNIYQGSPAASPTTWTKIASSPTFSYTYSSLTPGTAYALRVTATNTAGESTPSNYVSLTAQTCIYTLTVNKYGTGTGTVTSNPAGINCGNDCDQSYNTNTSVTLTAVPSAGSVFVNWQGGGCIGTNPVCTIVMNNAKETRPQFALAATSSPTPTKKPNGAPCNIDPECQSGICENNVCVGSIATYTPTTAPANKPYLAADVDRDYDISIFDFNHWLRVAQGVATKNAQGKYIASDGKEYFPNMDNDTAGEVGIFDFLIWLRAPKGTY